FHIQFFGQLVRFLTIFGGQQPHHPVAAGGHAGRQPRGQLPAPQRTAMTLAYYQDLRQHEIAAHLGCSQMQVSRLLRRGRAALAEHLTR
ncbi:MAG: sigma-70 family RNA polymerase sigma factor, partial [Actinomycetota bacterium]